MLVARHVKAGRGIGRLHVSPGCDLLAGKGSACTPELRLGQWIGDLEAQVFDTCWQGPAVSPGVGVA